MQELYIIRKTACYKPWCYSSTIYTTNKKLFDFIDQSEEEMFEGLDWTKYLERDLTEEEEEDFDAYALFDEGSVDPTYPFIVLAETAIYTE